MKVLNLPVRSRDSIIIENIWNNLSKNVYEGGKQFDGTEVLKIHIIKIKTIKKLRKTTTKAETL